MCDKLPRLSIVLSKCPLLLSDCRVRLLGVYGRSSLEEHQRRFPAKGLKGARRCNEAIALYRGDSWRLHFHLYYLNCPGKYVQWLYYQFMAPLATPLIQPLKHCNQWFKPCWRNIKLSRDRLQRWEHDRDLTARTDAIFPHFSCGYLSVAGEVS